MVIDVLNIKPKKILQPSVPITRNSLVWLLVIQIFVLTPHFLAVPVWIPVVWLGVVFWRWKIFQGAWNYPNKLHKTLVVIICSAGLLVSLGASFSLTAMVSLLLVGSILKLLEIKTRKDFILLVFLSFFILAAQFIFFNHFLAAFYGFVCLVILCAALMQLYQAIPAKNAWLMVRPTVFIFLQAIPIMVMLFVVMPRMGAFWSVPSPQHAKTGMSDSMSPGDFSELIQSDELAFRVTFNGDIPTHEKLYWRSLVFAYFDGRRWSQRSFAKQDLQSSSQAITGWRDKIDYTGSATTYEIVAEPTGKTWLYSLVSPKTWSDNVLVGRDLELQTNLPVNQRINYKVTSVLDYRFEADIPESEILKQNTQLPEWSNPETRRIAQEWFSEAGSTEKLIEKLFAYYRNSFFYTLAPPGLGNNSVDDFLWKTHQGFCEHFSSSFVFFMRAAGIPARVVVGYQGGELNPAENYLAVRQRDAHAWAEVWIKGRGWVLYDPTSAVAPERIRRGIAESLSATDQTLLAKPFGATFNILMSIRNQWDALNFQWVRWVMNYDSGLQSTLLTRLLNDVTPMRIALFVLGTGLASVLLIFSALFFRSRQKVLPIKERSAQLIYKQLRKKLQQGGFVPQVSETPRHFALRIADTRSDLKAPLLTIIDLYEQLVYAENTDVLRDLKSQVAAFSAR